MVRTVQRGVRTALAGEVGSVRLRLGGGRSTAAVRRCVAVYAVSPLCEWAVWIAVLVDAFERGGPATSGRVAIALLVPPMLVTPLVARAACRPAPLGIVGRGLAAQAACYAVAAAGLVLDGPLVVTVIATSVALCTVPFMRPCLSMSVPGLVTSSAQLTAVNAAITTADANASFLGPLGAAGLMAWHGPAPVFAVSACLAVAGAATVARLVPAARGAGRHPGGPATVAGDRVPSRARVLGGSRELPRDLIVAVCAPCALLGAFDLIGVSLALGALGLGSAGAGWLGALFGAGAVVGGMASRDLVARRRLAMPIVGALVGIAVLTAVLAAWTVLAVTAAVFATAGAARASADACGRTLLQRSVRLEALGPTLAVVELGSSLAFLFGSLITQALLALVSMTAALVTLSVVFSAVAAGAMRGLRRADGTADVAIVEVRLLRASPVLGGLPSPVLEQLARLARRATSATDEVVVSQGDVGDEYFVIVDGQVEVLVDGVSVRTMTKGSGFGEVALLADLRRTATVVARTPLTVLVIDRAAFLGAVLGHDAASRTAWEIARRWHAPLRTTDAATPEG